MSILEEPEIMLRRFRIMPLLMLGILMLTQAAFACASFSTGSDCCSSGTTAPCSKGSAAQSMVFCCAGAPAGSVSTLSAIAKSDVERKHGSFGEADLGLTALAEISDQWLLVSRHTRQPRLAEAFSSCAAQETYLRTGRLRL
jgi:hypothetical protein